jgi:hypothetical protein
MGGDVYKLIALLAVVVGVGAVAYYLRSNRCGQKPGIISEDINGSGDNWSADFRARVSAPEQGVFRALGKVENAKSDQILDIKVLSDLGSTKLVEVDFAGPTGSSVPTQFRFEFFSSQDRFTYKSLDSQVFQIDGDCRLQPECAATLIECRQATQLLQPRPLVDGVIKENIRQIFVAQLDSLRSALHVQIPDQTDGDNDEP